MGAFFQKIGAMAPNKEKKEEITSELSTLPPGNTKEGPHIWRDHTSPQRRFMDSQNYKKIVSKNLLFL